MMKINNIILYNFGSYEGKTNFETRTEDDRNIILIGGKNGAGKTTLFTAMRICLYGYMSMGYKSLNSFYVRTITKLINNTAKITRPTRAYVTMCIAINNGQDVDDYVLTRKWTLSETLVESFVVYKNDIKLTSEELADFEKYILSLIPPELFNLYFFDGEKIADFFLNEGSNTRIKEAFLTLCGYDTFDIMRRNFKRVNSTSASSTPSLEQYIAARTCVASLQSEYQDLSNQLKSCCDSITDCEATLEVQEKEYYNKGGITEEEWNQKLFTLKEEEKKRETYNSLLRKWANDTIPFLMILPQIEKLKEQIDEENKSVKYTYFCEILESDLIRGLINENLSEIKAVAFENFGTADAPILNLSLEQTTSVLSQINQILSFDKNKIEKCKKAIKKSINLSTKTRKELDESNIASVQDYMKKRAQLFEEKSLLLVQRVELEKEILEKKERLVQAEYELSRVHTRLEEELKKSSINDISARAIVMLDKLQEILYVKQIKKVETFFRKEINILMRKANFIDDIYIDNNFNTHIYRTEKVLYQKLIDSLRTNTEEQMISVFGLKAIEHLKLLSQTKSFTDMVEFYEHNQIESVELPIEIDKSSLSNGEKQIFIMALYHSLVSLCTHELPFIIDTPFARIDTEHRQNISKHFFSKLNGQVFILSTNEEINSSHVKILNEKIASTYMLENTDNKRTTVIGDSYFEV